METQQAPTVIISARVGRDMRDQLGALVKATGRNKNALIEEAIRRLLETEQWQLNDIAMGLQEADAGDFATADEIDAVRNKYQSHRNEQQAS